MAVISGLTVTALASLLGLLYLTWQPDKGCKHKTNDVLATSREEPRQPLTLDNVVGADLIRLLMEREVCFGTHSISLRIDADDNTELHVRSPDAQLHLFRLASDDPVAALVKQALKDPDGSGLGLKIVRDNHEHVLQASAPGLVAKIRAYDMDEGLGGVLQQQQEADDSALKNREPKKVGTTPSVLLLKYRSRTMLDPLKERDGEERIVLEPVPRQSMQFVVRNP